MNRVLQITREEPGDDISQAEIAELTGMSPAAFSRFFRHHAGKTFTQVVNEIRISKVCIQLLQTDKTVAEIAFGCGFQNLSNFNEQFRKYKKTSPSKYRRKLRARFAGR